MTYKRSFKTERQSTALYVQNVGLQRCEPNDRWGPGVRDHFLIHHVVAGRGAYTAFGRTYPIKAGQTFLSYPDTSITYCADVGEPWEYLWVGFGGSDARLLLSQTDFSPEKPVLSVGSGERLKKLLLRIYASRGNRPHEAAAMTGNLYVFLGYLMELAAHAPSGAPSQETAHRAAAFMRENFSHAITIADVARFVGASRSWLYRCFEQALSVSPSRYLAELRLERAALLLQSTPMNVAEVSYSVGYEDPEYFSRVFRQKYGCPPKQFAKEKGGKEAKQP